MLLNLEVNSHKHTIMQTHPNMNSIPQHIQNMLHIVKPPQKMPQTHPAHRNMKQITKRPKPTQNRQTTTALADNAKNHYKQASLRHLVLLGSKGRL